MSCVAEANAAAMNNAKNQPRPAGTAKNADTANNAPMTSCIAIIQRFLAPKQSTNGAQSGLNIHGIPRRLTSRATAAASAPRAAKITTATSQTIAAGTPSAKYSEDIQSGSLEGLINVYAPCPMSFSAAASLTARQKTSIAAASSSRDG